MSEARCSGRGSDGRLDIEAQYVSNSAEDVPLRFVSYRGNSEMRYRVGEVVASFIVYLGSLSAAGLDVGYRRRF
ncbi:hypothetical protein VNO80_23016 [Phaseolus coccineus]|uniref:Uncharacterized protein n=1 Tax=Phaseolus coccineus TaxID=3886 RepID=A0AAN9MBQ7_PHACN